MHALSRSIREVKNTFFSGVVVVVLLAASSSRAEETKTVTLEVVGGESDVSALEASLRDWLRSTPLSLRRMDAFTQPGNEPMFARVRVVWTDAACTVELFNSDGELTRRRSLPREGAALLVAEAAALITQAGLQELLLVETKRKPVVSIAPPLPVVVVAAEQPSPLHLELGGFLAGRSYDTQAPFVFGGGVEASTHYAIGAWRPGLDFRFAYFAPMNRDSQLASLQLQTLVFRLDAELGRDLGPLRISLGAGGGLDVLISQTSSAQVPQQSVRASRVDPAPFFDVNLGIAFQPSARTSISLKLVLDIDPAPRRYTAQIAESSTTLLEPWRVRPSVLLGFAFDVLGGSR